jgi:uncharacterized protein
VSARVLIVPGLGDSGPAHWQTHWQQARPGWRRVVQNNWDQPDRDDWIACLERDVRAARGKVILVGHSLACALIAHWAARCDTSRVASALLVAPSDVESPRHTPDEVRCFAPIPLAPLPFRSVVVASSNDRSSPAATTRSTTWRAPASSPGAGAAASSISARSGISTAP